MEIKQLIQDEDAVSPVIGVILMVAITVILAAVIGTFVLGLGDQVQDTAPQASFNYDFGGAAGSGTLTVTHDGGDTIDTTSAATLDIVSGGADVDNGEWDSSQVSAGDSATVTGWTSGASYRVVWQASNGDNTATLGQAEAP